MFHASHAANRGRPSRSLSCGLALVAAALLLAGCVGPRIVTPEPPPIPDGGSPVPENNEIVLSEGQQLVANAPWGPIKIEAGPGLRRVYTWRGHRRGVILEPRQQRFAGSLGIYYEGQPPVWEPAGSVTKVDLEEGQRRFETVDDAMIWMQIRRLRYSFTNDGLVVGWKIKGDTLVAEVWQFYIDGSKPESLPGADDSRVAVGPLEVVPQQMKPQLVYADGRTEPYTGQNTNRNTGQGSQQTAAADTSAQPAECGWFQNLLGQCADNTTDAQVAGGAASDSASATAQAGAAETGGTAAAGDGAATGAAASSAESQPAETQPERPQATISGNVVNVRSGPTTNADVLMQARQGDAVTILEEDADWRYVEFEDGRKGWVANFLLDHEE